MGEREHYATNVSHDRWEFMKPLLPTAKKLLGGPGRPSRDLRQS